MGDYFEQMAAADRARASRVAAALDRLDKIPIRKIVAAGHTGAVMTLIECEIAADFAVDEALELVEEFLHAL